MNQEEINFIKKRWAGRAAGGDIKKLVDEITWLKKVLFETPMNLPTATEDPIGSPLDDKDRLPPKTIGNDLNLQNDWHVEGSPSGE